MSESAFVEGAGFDPESDPPSVPSPEPLSNLLLERVSRSGDRIIAYSKVNGRWVGTTWREAWVRLEEIAYGLLELGVERGDRVAILSNTRQEWSSCDLAILSIGAITVGIYPTLTPHQVRYLLEHSGARVVFVEDSAQREKVQAGCADLDVPIQIVQFPGEGGGDGFIALEALRRRGAKRRIAKPEELERRMRENKSSDVATYVYTSGTTGEPKGAILTHANFHYVIHATQLLVPYEGHRTLTFLPMAHSLQRYVNYLGLITDVEGIYFAESLDRVRENILEVRPTAFAVIPRVLEKVHAQVMATGAEQSGLRGKVFKRSMRALAEVGAARRAGYVPGPRARAAARIADRLVGQKVRAELGGRVRFLGCGSAPLARDVHEFFEDIGVPILEGWGLTETSAPATMNTLANRRIGTVGRPLPGTEIKIAKDGEILVRGPGVFQGYHNDEVSTREAFDDEGWFKTGDIGFMARNGYLTITDRKKDIIITSGGKNVAPLPIEHKLKRDRLISQTVLLGDRRPYLVALIGLDPDSCRELARTHGLPDNVPPDELISIPEVASRIQARVDAVNADLSRQEQIKKWAVLPHELTVDTGELTPTLKVKRRVVAERHRERIDELYSSN